METIGSISMETVPVGTVVMETVPIETCAEVTLCSTDDWSMKEKFLDHGIDPTVEPETYVLTYS